jgi:hypothetical protein
VLHLVEGLLLLGVLREVVINYPLHVLRVGILRERRVPIDIDLIVLFVLRKVEVEDESTMASGKLLKDYREEIVLLLQALRM